ncbi:MAG TPA: hypothetical protein VLW53_16050, partial [Candidatus Eisenbacteria bacterium]|nr:hypothetical protein [Candidatus Eisenbacteria bacterium]
MADGTLRELGAWEYGLRLIADVILARVPGTDLPVHFAFELDRSPAEILSTIAPCGSDWAIKYSCSGPRDFSPLAMRGDNSSLGRTIHLTRQTDAFARSRIERLLYHAPRHTARIVFQELVDQSNGCLLHADLDEDRLELEVLFGPAGTSHRVLLTCELERDSSIETSGERRPSEQDVRLVARIASRLRECGRALAGARCAWSSWSIEGFWDLGRSTLRLLQLRPAPRDRPAAEPAPPAGGAVFESGFVWGVCDREVVVDGGELLADGVLSLCRSPREADWRAGYDAAALAGFASGRLDLVVRSDPAGASRLSHEPWFLPPPEYRQRFCHV